MHRLDPGVIPFRTASSFDVHVSGGEYNCAANLASCFGLKTGVATAMVNNGIGELIQRQVRAMGVRPFYKHFKHDGVRGPNMATVYSDRGQGVRPPVVFYNRANEAGAMLKPGDFDWDKIFAGGCRLVPQRRDLRGAVRNDRRRGGRRHAGRRQGRRDSFVRLELPRQAVGHDRRLGAGPEDDRQDRRERRRVDRQRRRSAKGTRRQRPRRRREDQQQTRPEELLWHDRGAVKKFPNVKAVATTLREVHSTNRHSWSAVLWYDGKEYVAPTAELDVIDRIGGGDGFASGLIYSLLDGRSPEEALQIGWAHGALLTTFPGDVSRATLPEVEAFAAGQAAHRVTAVGECSWCAAFMRIGRRISEKAEPKPERPSGDFALLCLTPFLRASTTTCLFFLFGGWAELRRPVRPNRPRTSLRTNRI